MTRLSVIVFVIAFHSVLSQDFKKYYSVVWDLNTPLSNTSLIGNSTLRGGRLLYREVINNRFSVGADLGFATYHDHLEPAVYQNGSNSLYAELFPYAYNYSLTFSGEYYLVQQNNLSAFAGLGIGAAYNNYTIYYNVFQDVEKVWGVLIRPNAGTLIKLGKNGRWAARLSVHYDYSSAKASDFDYKNFTNVGLDAGLALVFQ
jgi:hypothetical protein